MNENKKNILINSMEYWNERFEENWEEMLGTEQTAFFAEVALELLPQWLKTKISSKKLSICDFGCAFGQAVDILHTSLQTEVCGVDFSAQAVTDARNRFSQYKFIKKDIVNDDMSDIKFDVGYISNVLEHISDPWRVAKNISQCISRYLIIMIPFRETLNIAEHCNKFDSTDIPVTVGELRLVYVNQKDCSDMEKTLYPDKQILLVYSKSSKALEDSALDDYIQSFETEYQLMKDKNKYISELEEQLNVCRHNMESLTAEKQQLEQQNLHIQNELHNTEQLLSVSERKISSLENNIRNAIQACNSLNSWGLYKFSHFVHRTKHQFIQGGVDEKKKYMKWLRNYLKGYGTDLETKYKPIYKVAEILKGREFYISDGVKSTQLGQYLEKERISLGDKHINESEVQGIQKMLSTREYKGILVYPHVVCQEPLQTPQQLLKAFAQLGWLCFFCEGSDLPDAFREVEENVIIVHEKEFVKAVSDTEVVVLLTWLGSLAFVNNLKQKKIWYHILDKLDIFPYYGKAYLELHGGIISMADYISYVSFSVLESIQGREDAVYLPDCADSTKTDSDVAYDNTWVARAQSMENIFGVQFNSILSQSYTKFDVIIMGVIDYDFRFQRPQQLAVRYAENGHRVFYFNANHYNEFSVKQIGRNLYVIDIHSDTFTAIYLTDWERELDLAKKQFKKILDSYCIRDAVTIVDYPNWIYIAQMLRREYGFKIITDYMDDYTGFLNPSEELVRRNCENLLRTSDQIIASSQFLSDIACKFNEHVEIIRNGTEFEHFHKAYGESENGKIIGYYGAVAEWFDVDKVIYLAKNLPECEIQIIGHVTSGEDKLKRCPNIRLMGEKPYSELPVYLKSFNVCLIPFDTSTDLIKATNPVKFYEYLSAGKKIVATEIPELLPFKDKYVYMSNDNRRFLEYVELCLDGKDTLQNDEMKMNLAKSNDWQERYEKFMILSKECVPKISIVILTYNNLEFNKLCLHSILNTTAYPNYEIIVVDNNSTDGTREYLEKFGNGRSFVKIVFNNENKGFAAGNNAGMKEAEGDYIVLLNNDTVVTRGWLTAMCKHMENDAELGMCGPVTNSIGNEAQIAVTYHCLSELNQFSYNYTTAHLCEEYRDVKVLALFCTMIKKQIVDNYGFLDENYGIGMFEDDDYSEMVKSKGFHITIVEDAFIHHFHGVSFKKLEDERFKLIFQENKDFFEKKWKKKWLGHKMREGVDGMTNLDNTISLSEKIKGNIR